MSIIMGNANTHHVGKLAWNGNFTRVSIQCSLDPIVFDQSRLVEASLGCREKPRQHIFLHYELLGKRKGGKEEDGRGKEEGEGSIFLPPK